MGNLTLKIDVSWTGKASEKEVIDFIKYEIGYGTSISNDNPFINEDFDAEISIDDVDEY